MPGAVHPTPYLRTYLSIELLRRMGFAETTCPPSPTLEDHFYPNGRTIAAAAYDLVRGSGKPWMPAEREDVNAVSFRGPF